MNENYPDPLEIVPCLDDLPLWSAPFGICLLNKVPMYNGMEVLDLGCGTGFPLVELAMRLGGKSRVTGLDPEKAFLERAQEKIRAWKLSNASVVQGRAEKMPFPDGIFDLVVSNNGLNNVQDLPRSLAEIKRVCKRGAVLLITMNSPGSMLEFYNILEEVLADLNFSDRIPLMHQHIREKRPSMEYMLACMENVNIALDSVDHESFIMRYTDGGAFLSNGFIRLAFLPSWQQVIGERNLQSVLEELKKRINLYAGNYGEFRVTIPFTLYTCKL
ncbi:MAG: class I SAM-dependent methyltransferase [Bacteroidales bacterium]